MNISFLKRVIHKIEYEKAFLFKKKTLFFSEQKKYISFTFDDFPESAFINGARLLESYGVCGTFYTSMGLVDTNKNSEKFCSQETIAKIHNMGHEIGCHTYDHINCYQASPENIRKSCQKNYNCVKDFANISMQSFAWPCGDLDIVSKRVIGDMYKCARTVKPGINVKNMDLYALKSVAIYESKRKKDILKWIDRLNLFGGWLIFYTHDVRTNPSDYGCSIEYFESIIKEAVKHKLSIMPVKNVIEELLKEQD